MESLNAEHAEAHQRDLSAVSEQLDRRGISVDRVIERVQEFEVAVPSWALETGGTRFGRFPREGEPRNVYEKMDDISVIQRLTRTTPRVSLHIPWDEPDDVEALRAYAKALLVDRQRLAEYQKENDVLQAEATLKEAYEMDVSTLVAEARACRAGPLILLARIGRRATAKPNARSGRTGSTAPRKACESRGRAHRPPEAGLRPRVRFTK